MAIKPLEDKILVQALEAETTTASGLVIPDTAKEKPQEGTVVAVGKGRFDEDGDRIPMDIKEGDKVIFKESAATEIKYEGKEYLILSSRDVLAVIDGRELLTPAPAAPARARHHRGGGVSPRGTRPSRPPTSLQEFHRCPN